MHSAETLQVVSGGVYYSNTKFGLNTPIGDIRFCVLFAVFVRALFENGLTNRLEFHTFLPSWSDPILVKIRQTAYDEFEKQLNILRTIKSREKTKPYDFWCPFFGYMEFSFCAWRFKSY